MTFCKSKFNKETSRTLWRLNSTFAYIKWNLTFHFRPFNPPLLLLTLLGKSYFAYLSSFSYLHFSLSPLIFSAFFADFLFKSQFKYYQLIQSSRTELHGWYLAIEFKYYQLIQSSRTDTWIIC